MELVEIDTAREHQETFQRQIDERTDEPVADVLGRHQDAIGALDRLLDQRPQSIVVFPLVPRFDPGAMEKERVGFAGAAGNIRRGDRADAGMMPEDDIDLVDDRLQRTLIVREIRHGARIRHDGNLFLVTARRRQVFVDGGYGAVKFDVLVERTRRTFADPGMHEENTASVRREITRLPARHFAAAAS